MKRKITRKLRTQKNHYSVTVINIVASSFIVLIVVLVGTLTYKAINSPTVLGTATRSDLLTDQGNDTQEGLGDQNSGQLPPPTGIDHPSGIPSQGHFEGQREGNKSEIKFETPTNHREIKKEDNGMVHISTHQEGTNDMQSQNDGLDKINESLKDKDIKVSSTSGDGFSIESGRIHAETHFPLSVNPTTHTLTVTTPAGTKEVTILPDQAVQNLLQHQILSSINDSSGSGTTSNISLTQVGNQAVFAVPGQSDKKILGLFPVTFTKTVFVSAQTGQVVQTQENFLSKLLETFSF